MIISNLADIVTQRNISLHELSQRTGLTYKTILKLYYADFSSIRIEVLDALCNILEVAPGDIFHHIPNGKVRSKPRVPRMIKPRHPNNKRAKAVKVARVAKASGSGKTR